MRIVRIVSQLTVLLILSGCTSTYYDVSKSSDIADVAVLYTVSKGVRPSTTYELKIDSIDGKKLLGKSSRWLYISPGKYSITITGFRDNAFARTMGGISGAMVGNNATRAIVSAEQSGRIEKTRYNGDSINLDLEPGKFYIFDPIINNGQIESINLKVF